MGRIVILDEKTANQIAAGEVIERPASVVKEMAENAIDAGANQITVEIKNGGISYIRVTDNGSGMEGDDVEIAFERHATSKIRRIEDLDALATMGFRGEALASIAAVSHLEVTTKTEEAKMGTRVKLEGGRVVSAAQAGCPKGTSFIVRNLFYNTPARYKFLKKDSTEAGYVSDIIERLALARPDISFKFIQDNQVRLHTPGNHDLLSVIYSIFGKDTAKSVLQVQYENEGISVTGFAGKPEIARGTRNCQSFFLHGRYIKSRIIANALEEAYKTLLMQKKFPFCVLYLTVPTGSFDVNVHPQKLEVRFSNESAIYSAVYHGVKNTLLGTSLVREFDTVQKSVAARPIFSAKPEIRTIPEKPLHQASLFDTLSMRPAIVENVPVENKNIAPAIGSTENKIIDGRNTDEADRANKADEADKTVKTDKADKADYVIPSEDRNITAAPAKEEPSPVWVEGPQPEESPLTQLMNADIAGQVFDTYILMQYGDNLYVIDQHAAHERIRYETLKKRMEKEESFSQMLMEPLIIKLSASEFSFVMDKQDSFRRLGFDIGAFGPNTIILRSVPDFYDCSFGLNDFQDILDRWMQSRSNESGISDEALYMMSCKGAIKANRSLSKEEIRGLVKDLCSMENPYTCVHGRPVIMMLEKKEFEKRFKRIV